MKALGLVVSDKKNFESFILKTYFLTPLPTYATNWNGLNNFDRGPPRDHSYEVWSKSNKRFQRRCRLKKLLTHGRMQGRTDDGHWRITKAHFVLRWANNRRGYVLDGKRQEGICPVWQYNRRGQLVVAKRCEGICMRWKKDGRGYVWGGKNDGRGFVRDSFLTGQPTCSVSNTHPVICITGSFNPFYITNCILRGHTCSLFPMKIIYTSFK